MSGLLKTTDSLIAQLAEMKRAADQRAEDHVADNIARGEARKVAVGRWATLNGVIAEVVSELNLHVTKTGLSAKFRVESGPLTKNTEIVPQYHVELRLLGAAKRVEIKMSLTPDNACEVEMRSGGTLQPETLPEGLRWTEPDRSAVIKFIETAGRAILAST